MRQCTVSQRTGCVEYDVVRHCDVQLCVGQVRLGSVVFRVVLVV